MIGRKKMAWRTGLAGCLGLVSIAAYPQVTASQLLPAEPATLDAPPTTPAITAAAAPLRFAVCSEQGAWQRPSESTQQKLLQTDPRYQDALQEEPLKTLSSDFWQHDIISFTTYGLSARTEPINLSGLWTVAEQIWSDCYAGDEGDQINAGETAEAWLINHRVTDLRWQGNQYVMTVEPAEAGVQVVQFERLDANQNLPLTVVTATGQTVDVLAGDW
jgi:hypothetical protein